MADAANLDILDYAILKTLADEGRPLWKSRLHHSVTEEYDGFPDATNDVSVQTIGRRIDRLASEGYTENVIVDPDDISRNLVIAYTLTDEGEDALKEKQKTLLKQIVKHNIFPEDDDPGLSKEGLLSIMQDYFDFSDEVREQFAEFEYTEIVTFLTIRYARKKTVDVLDEGHLSDYSDILKDHNDLLHALGLE